MATKKTTEWGGSITVPDGCKPSEACERTGTRPVISHGYLKRRKGDLWLFTTDAYIAVALKVDGDAQEGWVPYAALRKMETREARRCKLTFEQVDERSWRVITNDKSEVTTYTATGISGESRFPDFSVLADGLLFTPADATGPIRPFGFNTELLTRVGKALGSGLRCEITEPLRPIRFTALGHDDRIAMQMPIRLMDERDSSLRAAA